MSTVSIMPGIEARAPERTETSSGALPSPKPRPVMRPTSASRRVHSLGQAVGIAFAVFVIMRADFRRDRETGRDWQAEIGHFGQIGALAAEQVAHVGCTFGLAVAEGIDPFRHHGPLSLTTRADARYGSSHNGKRHF